MPYVISVFHQKGGVAKTTTTLALGACLVEHQHEVLLLDLDPQANLTSGLGLNAPAVRHSLADVVLGQASLLRLTRETPLPGLDVVPGHPDLGLVARALPTRERYEYALRAALSQPDMAHYDFVLIDCPPALGPLAVLALTTAHMVIVPTQCEYFSMQALQDTLELVALTRQKTNPALRARILVTLFDQRGQLHARALEQLRRHFKPLLFNTLIGVDSKLRESQMAGQLITQYAPSSRGAQHHRQLAEELLSYVPKEIFSAA